jgi:hypothetical protein
MLPRCDVQRRELAGSARACKWRWTLADISCSFTFLTVIIINVRIKDTWQGTCFHSVCGVIQWAGGHEVKVMWPGLWITRKNTRSWLGRGWWRCHYYGKGSMGWIVILVNEVLAWGIWLASLNEVRLESCEKETVSCTVAQQLITFCYALLTDLFLGYLRVLFQLHRLYNTKWNGKLIT